MSGNKYAGKCYLCGGHVPAGAGVLFRNVNGLRYAIAHRSAEWRGSPVSGKWVGGCPTVNEEGGQA